jgi:hypothetical protein
MINKRSKELLIKPWNPYMRRHSSLTEKAKIENLSRRMCVQGLKIVVTANRLIILCFTHHTPHTAPHIVINDLCKTIVSRSFHLFFVNV